MAKTLYSTFDTIKELKAFEVISSGVSEKYVPIFTSEIIEILSPEFKFVSGEKYYNFNSAHTVFLEDTKGTRIAISNSYDRTRAFSAYLISEEMRIPLNLDRQIHLGSEAAVLVENFKLNKPEFFVAIEHAKEIVGKLKTTNIPEYLKEEIVTYVFDKPLKRKGVVELDLVIAETDYYNTCYGFINTVIGRYVKGDYNLVVESKTHKDGEIIRKGIKLSSRFIKLQVTNAVYNYLAEELPELFI